MAKTQELISSEIAWDLFTYAYSYDGSSQLEYLGRAPIGSSKANAVWQIVKFIYSGTLITDKVWAVKGSWECIWNDRITGGYTYS